jgi:hypothetical protein
MRALPSGVFPFVPLILGHRDVKVIDDLTGQEVKPNADEERPWLCAHPRESERLTAPGTRA